MKKDIVVVSPWNKVAKSLYCTWLEASAFSVNHYKLVRNADYLNFP